MHCWGQGRFACRIWPLPHRMSTELVAMLWGSLIARRCLVVRWCFTVWISFIRGRGLWRSSIVSRLKSWACRSILSRVRSPSSLAWTLATWCGFHPIGKVILRIVLIKTPLQFLQFLSLRFNSTQKPSACTGWSVRWLFNLFLILFSLLLRVLDWLRVAIVTLISVSQRATLCRLMVIAWFRLWLQLCSTALLVHIQVYIHPLLVILLRLFVTDLLGRLFLVH